MKHNRNGFAHIILIPIVLIVFAIVGYVGYIVYQGNRSTYREINDAEVPLIKSLGVNIGAYDPQTKRAGDLIIEKAYDMNVPLIDFGLVIPATSVGPEKTNPQPTFVVPPGTEVASLIDGVVVKVEQIYSGDYTIHVAPNKNSWYIYETEHVINPRVSNGDKVTAGQVIAEASNYAAQGNNGNAVLEIGILLRGNPPAHICPFKYLDPSIKDETLANLRGIYEAWNERNGTEVIDIDSYSMPGCVTTETVHEEER